ncbi:MAG: glycosyltransferase [Candidatus Omnitrophica bacterium]|nr:glycosyltransferase [Candidatus Omnitrophota bacterium]
MKKLCIFYHNTGSLGHARIVYVLVKAISAQSGKSVGITVIETGRERTRLFPIDRYAKISFIPQGDRSHAWSRALLQEIKKIRPHVFVTEQYPFFRHPEHRLLLPILTELRSSKTVTISSATHLDWTNSLPSFLPMAYDMVLYHRPETEINAYKKYLPLKEKERLGRVLLACRKIFFPTGFIYDQEMTARRTERKKGRGILSIVVSRGGLSENPGFIRQCLKLALKRKDWHFTMSMGAMELPHSLARLLGRLDNLDYFSWSYPEFEDKLRDADVSLNFAGYNTMVSLLKYRTPAVISPVKTAEQLWNANFLRRHLAVRIIGARDTDPGHLEALITRLREDKQPGTRDAIPDAWFEGARRSADMILGRL